MSRRLVFRPAARLELAEASDWYDSNKQGLGGEFIRAFEAAAARVCENPFQYQLIFRNVRRAPVGRFRHGLMYTVSDEEIVVISCFHGRRNPRHWRGRIRE